jgi:death-on-curing protein
VAVGHPVDVGDWGLLDAAVARPQATVFGQDAYDGLFEKAAALFQSLARNHALSLSDQ